MAEQKAAETKLPVAFKNEQGRVLPYSATLAKHVKKFKLQPLYDDAALKKAQDAESKPTSQTRRGKVQAEKAGAGE